MAGLCFIFFEIAKSNYTAVKGNPESKVAEKSFEHATPDSPINHAREPAKGKTSVDTLKITVMPSDTTTALIPETAATKMEVPEITHLIEIEKKGHKNIETTKEHKIKTSKAAVKKNADTNKPFTQAELKILVKRISRFKENHPSSTNCIQIHTTAAANNKIKARQIERYLKSQKFSIAGRESVATNVSGIQLTPNGSCIRLTIGSF
ncbi:MAG: hypothetical protein JWQ40_4508 [Segetibacter sp.]|nr:hypothetical protein [Segetibacter sp.]